MEKSSIIIREPIPHWNNFNVVELKEILEHCEALERLGIAQDEEMMNSIKRDITIRENKKSMLHAPFQQKHTKQKQQTQKHKHININKRQQPQNYLLEQEV